MPLLKLALDTLCRHNFGHYAIVGASSIVAIFFFQHKENDSEKKNNNSISMITVLRIVNSLELSSIRRELISVRYYYRCWLIVRCFVWLCLQYFWMQLCREVLVFWHKYDCLVCESFSVVKLPFLRVS